MGQATDIQFRTVQEKDWLAEGERLFGPDKMQWRFVCPVCGYVAKVSEWREAGAPEGAVGFSCVGRWRPPGPGEKQPCNYAGGGLFRLNPVTIIAEARGVQNGSSFEFDK